jgi:hypothetical protein
MRTSKLALSTTVWVPRCVTHDTDAFCTDPTRSLPSGVGSSMDMEPKEKRTTPAAGSLRLCISTLQPATVNVVPLLVLRTPRVRLLAARTS